MFDIDSLSKIVTTREVKPGEVLVTQGASTDTAYILDSGELEVLRDGQVVGKVVERGAIIGEIAFLLKSPHQASVVSKTFSKVLVLNGFDVIAANHPAIMTHMAETLARRLLATNAALAGLKSEFYGILSEKQIDASGNKEIKSKLVAFWNAFDRVMTTKIADF